MNINNSLGLVVYKKNVLFRGSTSAHFIIIGEIGFFKSTEYVLMNVLESEKEVKIFPLGTHRPLFDRLVGYALVDYRRIVKIYERRFPQWMRNIHK